MKRATVVSGLVVVFGARVLLRVRPILMTALATTLRMIPMAMGPGEGIETNPPLARAVIGGLSVSTFLTLFLIPVLYLTLFLIPTLYLWLERGGYRHQEALDEASMCRMRPYRQM